MKQILLLTLSLFCFGEIHAKENRSNDDVLIATLKEDAKLYETASTKSTVLYDIRNGNTVKVLEQGKTMSRIKFLRLTGYVDTSKLNIKNFNSNTASQPRAESTSTRSSSTTTNSPRSTSPSTVKSSTSSSRSSSTRSSSSYSSTCGARTKKGGSCKRKVSGGGYCWQHR